MINLKRMSKRSVVFDSQSFYITSPPLGLISHFVCFSIVGRFAAYVKSLSRDQSFDAFDGVTAQTCPCSAAWLQSAAKRNEHSVEGMVLLLPTPALWAHAGTVLMLFFPVCAKLCPSANYLSVTCRQNVLSHIHRQREQQKPGHREHQDGNTGDKTCYRWKMNRTRNILTN